MRAPLLLLSVAGAALCFAGMIWAPPAFGQGGVPPTARGKNKDKLPPAKPTPRLPDGRPDLGNGSGVWNPAVVPNLAGKDSIAARSTREVKTPVDVGFLPEARKVYEQRNATLSKDDPEAQCLPPGIPRMIATPFPFQIYQLSDRVIFLFEGGAHIFRIVYTDGRQHPKDINPSYMGDAIGHWDGDTLVVDTVGFNDGTWLDQVGHPHSDVLHVIERYTRTDSMTLHYEVTIDDAKTYAKPWTSSFDVPWEAGWDIMEYICQENNKDLHHLVGK